MNSLHTAYCTFRIFALTALMLLSVSWPLNVEAVDYLANLSNVSGLGLYGASEATFNPNMESNSEATLDKDSCFYVNLESPISLSEEVGLVLMFRRWNKEGSPKATLVEGSTDRSTWDVLGYSYMQFRGGEGTVEYSKPIYANENTAGKKYMHLRFKVLKTALGYTDDGKVRFNKFNAFLLKMERNTPTAESTLGDLIQTTTKIIQLISFSPQRVFSMKETIMATTRIILLRLHGATIIFSIMEGVHSNSRLSRCREILRCLTSLSIPSMPCPARLFLCSLTTIWGEITAIMIGSLTGIAIFLTSMENPSRKTTLT